MLLLPANEVWGKVIFSQACVSHSVHRGGLFMMSLPVCLPGPMFLLGVYVSGPIFLLGCLPDRDLHPWTETSWTVTPLDGVLLDRDPRTETPWTVAPRMVKSGWYAPYWNAFWFLIDWVNINFDSISILQPLRFDISHLTKFSLKST